MALSSVMNNTYNTILGDIGNEKTIDGGSISGSYVSYSIWL